MWGSSTTHLKHGLARKKEYLCGFCDKHISSDIGLFNGGKELYFCSSCENPTFFDNEFQYPGSKFGREVSYLPNNLALTYEEARRGYSVCNYTSITQMCRKIIMNVAVDKGAKEGLSFVEYVNYLEGKEFIAKGMKVWVDKIRLIGNESTHEIKLVDKQTAENCLKFTEMLLKIIYEFPNW